MLSFYEIIHVIAKYNEPRCPIQSQKEELSLPASIDMVNLMIGESAGYSALALMESKYRSKINVEEDISSLIPRFEKMRAINKLMHLKIIVKLFVESGHFQLV